MKKGARLLVVDGNRELCQTLADILGEEGFWVDTAFTGGQALEKLEGKFYNVVLLDIRLPDMEGIEALRQLKRRRPETEVIIMTGYASLENSVAALREDAFAYMLKPMSREELVNSVGEALEKQQGLLRRSRELAQAKWDREVYRQLSILDGLTELYNYRYFRQALAREVALSQRYNYAVSLLMMDVDNFKQYNDTYGHEAGNRALRQMARRLRTSCREVDMVARYGGEEFVMVMPHTAKREAGVAAERLRMIFAQGVKEGSEVATISIGVAGCPEDTRHADELIKMADQALLEAKKEKNQVCLYG